MKKAIYILLIISSMGFTIEKKVAQKEPAEKYKPIDLSSAQGGYIEVSSPASYSLTIGN